MTITADPTDIESADVRARLKDSTASVPLLRRIRAEYVEMPGLTLTLQQAARLWNLTVFQADRLLSQLLEDGFLMRDARGRYRRRGCPRCE